MDIAVLVSERKYPFHHEKNWNESFTPKWSLGSSKKEEAKSKILHTLNLGYHHNRSESLHENRLQNLRNQLGKHCLPPRRSWGRINIVITKRFDLANLRRRIFQLDSSIRIFTTNLVKSVCQADLGRIIVVITIRFDLTNLPLMISFVPASEQDTLN